MCRVDDGTKSAGASGASDLFERGRFCGLAEEAVCGEGGEGGRRRLSAHQD